MTIKEMQQKLVALTEGAQELMNKTERSPEEQAALDTALSEAEVLSVDMARRERLENLNAKLAQPTTKRVDARPTQQKGSDLDRFFVALAKGPQYINAANDIFQEGVNADGGYLLPVDRRTLVQAISAPNYVHTLCDVQYTDSNSFSAPVDMDPVWSTSLDASGTGEGVATVEEKVAFIDRQVLLDKSTNLARVSTEMLQDGTGIGEYLIGKLGGKLGWSLHAKAVAAFVASPAKVTVTKTSGSATGSAPDLANILTMYGRMLVDNRQTSVWIANPQLESTFVGLNTGANGFPVYLPAGSIANEPNGKLLGRPIIYVEGLPAVGTEGDLMLVDPKTFWFGMKRQGARVDVSVHAEFKSGVVLYRGEVRSKCVSKWNGTVTRPDSTTAGNVITVATR